MAERVSSLLRRSVEHLASEVPKSYRLVLDKLGPMIVEVDVDGDVFSLRGGQRLEVADGAVSTAGARITTSREAILDVLDAKVGLGHAVEDGRRSRAGLTRRRAACTRHPARVRPRRGPGAVPTRPARSTTGGKIMTEAIPTQAIPTRPSHPGHPNPRVVQATPHGRGPGWRHRRAHRRSRTGRARLRCHRVRTSCGRALRPGRVSGRRLPPVKLGGLAASQYSTVGPYTGSLARAAPLPGPSGHPRDPARAVAGEHGFRFFPAYYIHIWDLFQRIPRLPAHRPGSRRCPLDTDLAHDHGQRQAGGHPGHDGRRQAVARLPPRGATQPRRIPHHRRPAHGTGLHPARYADLREPAAGLPRHQSRAPRIRAAEPVGIRLLRGARCSGRPRPVQLFEPLQRRAARNAASTSRIRHALRRCPHECVDLPSAPAADGSPRQQGRRGTQRSDHRVVVRPLVPPPRRAWESVSSTARPPRLEPPVFDPTTAAASQTPRASDACRRHAAGA